MKRLLVLLAAVAAACVLAAASAADGCACGGFNPHAYDSGCHNPPVAPFGYEGVPYWAVYQCWNPWNGTHVHIWY